MIQFLLFVLYVFSVKSTVTLDKLHFYPNLITKESILANYSKLTNEPLFTEVETLAFITQWNPRGFLLARKRATRLNYVSNVWFEVRPHLKNGEMIDVEIHGASNINQEFIRNLRKKNPDIKIVPRFYFDGFSGKVGDVFVQRETLVQKAAQKIANFCMKRGFDGAVIDTYSAFFEGWRGRKLDVLETWEQIGKVLRRNHLFAILAIPAPINFISDNQISPSMLTKSEAQSLLGAYDRIQIWTYSDVLQSDRKHIHDEFLVKNMEIFDFSPKILIGINFYGMEYELDRMGRNMNAIGGKRFLEVLKMDDAELKFNVENKEHELISRSSNSFILFPTLTTLEYRISIAKKFKVGVSFWDYGQGLDYFTNLV